MTPRAALSLLVVAACSRQPREPAQPPPHRSVGDRNITITKRDDAGPDVGEVAWQGDPGPALPASGTTLIVIAKDDNVMYEPPNDAGHSFVLRERFHRTQVWIHNLADGSRGAAALLRDGDTIFVAHYSGIDSGGTIHALDLATGAERWSTPITGLGPVAHSQYANHIELGMVRGALAVFGNESGGRYIEVFDPTTGKMRSTRRLPPP